MKKTVLGFLVLAFAATLRAEDSYIYWLQSSATFDGGEFSDQSYQAKFVAIEGDNWSYGGGTYLDIYAAGQGGTPGSVIPNSAKDGVAVNLSTTGAIDNNARYVNISSAIGTAGVTYFIELYNTEGIFARSDGLTQSDASVYVFTTGTSITKPATGFSAMAFVPAAAPEPTSGLMLLLGSALLALRRKRS